MNVNEIITQRIIEKLGAGTNPWKLPYTKSNLGQTVNLVTGKPYRGINAFLTALAGFNSLIG
jgi:antirestriction protein ArdC